MSLNPVDDIHVQLKAIRGELETLKSGTLGDRNDIESYKRTLRGRLEIIEASTLKFVSQADHDELKKIVERNSKALENATGALNTVVRTVVGAALGGLGIWLFNRVIGGG